MPRNSAGTYSLPESAFVPNTPISSSATNSNNSDLADAMTGSLSRTGQGGMTAALGLALSGVFYTSDPDTGMSRSAANTQVITCGGEEWTFSETDLTAPDGSSLLPLIGEIKMWALPTAPTGYVLLRGQACTTTYPLWRAALIAAGNPYGTSGGDPLFPNMQCVVPAGVDASSRGLLTGSTVLGALLGAQEVQLTGAQLAAHTHTGTTGAQNANHTHTIAELSSPPSTSGQFSGLISPNNGWGGAPSTPTTTTSIEGQNHGHAFTTDSAGSSVPHPNVQPTLVINFIGRAA